MMGCSDAQRLNDTELREGAGRDRPSRIQRILRRPVVELVVLRARLEAGE